jgi:hypothetical protein
VTVGRQSGDIALYPCPCPCPWQGVGHPPELQPAFRAVRAPTGHTSHRSRVPNKCILVEATLDCGRHTLRHTPHQPRQHVWRQHRCSVILLHFSAPHANTGVQRIEHAILGRGRGGAAPLGGGRTPPATGRAPSAESGTAATVAQPGHAPAHKHTTAHVGGQLTCSSSSVLLSVSISKRK